MKRSLSLVNRVSVFFLVSLALVLACYSAVLYGVLSHQLQQQFDEQLRGAFRTLVAAVEVEADDVKFEASDHTVALGTENGLEDVRWVICDEQGLLVDRSRNLTPGKSKDDALLAYASQLRTDGDTSVEVGHWRVLQKRLAASDPKPVAERAPLERAVLVVTVGRSPDDLNDNLRLIGGLVIVLPLVVGLAAAIIGRRIVRQALQPVRDMARQARAMAQADADRRLPVTDAGDELSELGESFNALLDRLFETLARQQRFAGDAAHQLRTPLTAIVGQLDVSLRRTRSADDYRETMSVVREQAGELMQIVESLLFLARAQNEGAIPDRQRLRLSQWLPEYLLHWSQHPRHDDITLRGDALQLDTPIEIEASPVLLKQLLDNLVGNALKYSEAGTAVDIVATIDHDEVEIAVIDRGMGIAPEDISAVFEPFFRSTAARHSGAAGTGLGLAVARQIAMALGGRLTCQSELEKGSRFAFVLISKP